MAAINFWSRNLRRPEPPHRQFANATKGDYSYCKMSKGIEFRNKWLNHISLKIAAGSRFDVVISTINDIHFTGLPVKDEHVHFAVMELVNNSLRAQRETGRTTPIRLEYECLHYALRFVIQDAGGGFDPKNLPYDIHQPASNIDIHGPAFQAYREKHEFQRFGMGLYAVKKVFTSLNISFIDAHHHRMDWQPGKTWGTRIEGLLEKTHEA